jgi:small-conductance mechanosensitive channel
MTKPLLFLLLFAAALAGSSALAQNPPPAQAGSPGALNPAEAQRTIELLQDPQQRDRLIETLRAIAKGAPGSPEPASEPEPALTPNGLGAQLLDQVAAAAERLEADAAATVKAVTDFPLLWGWAGRLATDPERRALAIDTAWQLALVLIGAVLLDGFAAAVMRRPIAALTRHAPDNGPNGNGNGGNGVAGRAGRLVYRTGAWPLLRRLPFALARLALDLVPVAIFVAAGSLLAGLVSALTTRVVILTIIDAYAVVRIVMSVGRMLMSPASGRIRLLQIAASQAEYLIAWLRRVVLLGVWGSAVAQIAFLFGLDGRARDTLIRLVALIVAAMLIGIVLRGRQAVARHLRRPETEGGIGRWRDWLAGVWHYLAILAIAAGWVLWAAGIRDGLGGLRLVLGTVAVLVAARLIAILGFGIVDRAAHIGPRLERRYPGLELHTARYQAPARALLGLAIAIAAMIVLLQLWGAHSFLWFEPGRVGAHLLSALTTIALAALAAILVWEGANAALERRLALMSDAGSAAHAARLRTLLPMLRATLFVAVVAVVGLTALSQIGVNIGPLLAGAGVVGVAIGFGAQKLVQDVITGMFVLFENAIQVGDTVTVAGLSGNVERLSIRALWLRGGDGAVHIVPFSAVTTITNANRGMGNAAITVTVAAKEDTDKVAAALREIAAELRHDPEFAPMILGDLDVWVDAVKASGATLAGSMPCTPAGRAAVEHELNRRLQKRFQELGIELA